MAVKIFADTGALQVHATEDELRSVWSAADFIGSKIMIEAVRAKSIERDIIKAWP